MNILNLIVFVWYLFYSYKLYKGDIIIPQKFQAIFIMLLGIFILI
nr:MAG TPA: hypothetical protein [Caudoviricetes sp.]